MPTALQEVLAARASQVPAASDVTITGADLVLATRFQMY